MATRCCIFVVCGRGITGCIHYSCTHILYAYIHVHSPILYIHACTHSLAYTHIGTHNMHVYMYTCTHAHAYTHTHTHTHTQLLHTHARVRTQHVHVICVVVFQSQGASPKSSPKISPKINKKMVSVPNLLRPLPPEPVENNIQISPIMENGTVPHKDPKSRSQSVPDVLPPSVSPPSPPLRSPPLKKYSYNDFEYLKVLGKGSFGKVMYFSV